MLFCNTCVYILINLIYTLFHELLCFFRAPQKRPLQEDRRRIVTDFVNNDHPGGKRRWQSSNIEPKTVFSRLSARVPSNADDSADEDDSVIKVIYLRS